MTPKLRTLIDNLSAIELKSVHEYTAVRMAFGLSGGVKRTDDYPGIVLDIIIDECRRAGLDRAASPTRLKASRQYKSFAAKVEDEGLADFFREASASNRVRSRKLIRLSVELLIKNLLTMNVPVSTTMVMAHVHRIPGVLNRAFPGYAAGGMLNLVIDAETQEVQNVR